METTSAGVVNGRRALVTASTQGAGAAIARRFRQEGVMVWTTARSQPDQHPDSGRFIAADLTTVEGTSNVVARVSAAGGLDILVHVLGGSDT
ncbi:MAG: SDR family NAD(P)-dependent oxidoreductase [Actinomycetota bacterium]|nr:SDR family NAD(P)-dependent oxidoreductase [Actinomycetota bacterium]